MSSVLQSVSFPKSEWSKSATIKWLKKNSISPIKEGHETKDWIHYRIVSPPSHDKVRWFSKHIDGSHKGKTIPITITLFSDKSNENHGMRGGVIPDATEGILDSREVSDLDNPRDFQTAYPLMEEGSILTSDDARRGISNTENEFTGVDDKGRIALDITSDEKVHNEDVSLRRPALQLDPSHSDYWLQFGPDTLLGAMMLPKSEGGIGFPFLAAQEFIPLIKFYFVSTLIKSCHLKTNLNHTMQRTQVRPICMVGA